MARRGLCRPAQRRELHVAVVTVRNEPTPVLPPSPTPDGLSRTGDVTSVIAPVALAAGGLMAVAGALVLRRRRKG